MWRIHIPKLNSYYLIQMWKCTKCERVFPKTNQVHSCRFYPIENHFKGKEEIGKPLFEHLVQEIKKHIGPIRIESLSCCIHLVGDYAFCGVWIGKDKIKLDFRSDEKIKDKRILKEAKISAHRYMYYLEITREEDVDAKLLEWIKAAYILSKDITDK